MGRVGAAVLAGLVVALPLMACSKSELPPVEVTPTRAVDPQSTMQRDKAACEEEARRKGISSVTRLLLLRGKISKSDFADCMRDRGYDVME